MNAGIETSPFISNIKYQDYLALLCYMDAEWTRFRPKSLRRPYSTFLRTQRHFAAICRLLKHRINGQYKKWLLTNKGSIPHETKYINADILNPLFFLPFGHPDSLGIVLLDDFDPLHHLTGQMKVTMEESCLGFCPKLESLGLEGRNDVFCNLSSLMPPEYGTSRETWRKERHPMLVFTKYRMEGFGAVGYALAFQQSLLVAMARRIVETVKRLNDEFDKVPIVSKLIVRKKYLNSIRCVFLDLQGPEEIGTLMFCHNFSSAMSLVAALRTLTFSDVLKAQLGDEVMRDRNMRLEELYKTSKAHRAIIELAQAKAGKSKPWKDALYDNHVFRWTHSSLAVSPEAFFATHDFDYDGYVEASEEVQVAPGHWSNVELELNRNLSKGVSPKTSRSDYHSVHIGTADLTISPTRGTKEDVVPLIPISSVLSFLREKWCSFVYNHANGRDIVDITTALAVPVPKIPAKHSGDVDFPFKPKSNRHTAPFCETLPEINRRLFYFHGAERYSDRCKRRPASLSIPKLQKEVRRYGVPVSLRRTIEYLYQDLATIMRDPFLWDTVVDLFDTFATLHAVLTEHLPRQMKNTRQELIDEQRIDQLATLVEAIHNALTHRILNAYPAYLIRETAVDFRGGLNQILYAADAPVKCGLGMLRKYVYEKLQNDDAVRVPPSIRNQVGGLIQIGFTPGAACHSLNFGTEKYAKLAFFEVDVPHVLHVASYCDNLHEAFHLTFDVLRVQNPKEKLFSINNPLLAERVSEVFANLLSLIFIFGCDSERFLYYQLCTFSKSPVSQGVDDADTIGKSTELLIRLFFVIHIIRLTGPQRLWSQSLLYRQIARERTIRDFEKMVIDFGRFIRGFENLWSGSHHTSVKKYCLDQFDEIYQQMFEFLPLIWGEVFKIHECFRDEGAVFDYSEKGLQPFVEFSLEHGRPLIGYLFPSERTLKPLPLVCAMLREYVPSKPLVNLEGMEIHLPRQKENRDVELNQKPIHNRQWNEFLVDLGSACKFSPVPSARRRRLRKQITITKTLWDISSSMRGKRLWEILRDNWYTDELMNEDKVSG